MENKGKPINQSAFPVVANDKVYSAGMDLRDYFANSAMQGHFASEYGVGVHCDDRNREALAEIFYSMADAMLKQREL